MKTYRIEYVGGTFGILAVFFCCFTVALIPLGIALFPTMYRIVEEREVMSQ